MLEKEKRVRRAYFQLKEKTRMSPYINYTAPVISCIIAPLQEKLGNAALFVYDLMERVSGPDFGNSRYLRDETILADGTVYYYDDTLEYTLGKYINNVLTNKFNMPISGSEETAFTLVIYKLKNTVSYLIALEDEKTDILECIRELFPLDLKLVPLIISLYHSESTTTILTQNLEDALKNVHMELYGRHLVYGKMHNRKQKYLKSWRKCITLATSTLETQCPYGCTIRDHLIPTKRDRLTKRKNSSP